MHLSTFLHQCEIVCLTQTAVLLRVHALYCICSVFHQAVSRVRDNFSRATLAVFCSAPRVLIKKKARQKSNGIMSEVTCRGMNI